MIVPSNVMLVVQITVRVSSLQVNSAFGRRLQSAGKIGVISWMNIYFIVSVFCLLCVLINVIKLYYILIIYIYY